MSTTISGSTMAVGRPLQVLDPARLEPVQPLDRFRNDIRIARERLITELRNPILPQLIATSTISLRNGQTPLRNQLSRGTCWAFGGIAALEAAYRRKHGLELDLSEHFLFHAVKAHEADGGLSSFTGFGGSPDVVKHLSKITVPIEAEAPYLDEPAMFAIRDSVPEAGKIADGIAGTEHQRDAFEYDTRHIPLAARWNARYGVAAGGYGLMENFTNEQIEGLIGAGHEVVVSVTTPQGAHVVLLVGYNRLRRIFEVKNSWNRYDEIPYDDATPGAMVLDRSLAGWITEVIPPAAPAPLAPAWVGTWRMDHDGWRGKLIIRRTVLLHGNDPRSPQTICKLGSYEDANGARSDINGYLLDNGQRMVFHLTPPNAPNGLAAGQCFEVVLFGRDLSMAAGRTTWDNKPFGVLLSRMLLPGLPSPSFDRNESIGTWWFRHDGWTGALRLGAPAVHRDTENRQRSVAAEGQPVQHVIKARIPFDPANSQPFDLLLHTREDGVLSGTTQWGGRPFGVAGFLQAPLYAVKQDGELLWYGHDGRVGGTFEWSGPQKVGTGWQDFRQVIPGGDGTLYGLTREGKLLWYRHRGRAQGRADWLGPREVGTGWGDFVLIVGAPGGVLYAIRRDGVLLWYRHVGRGDGSFTWEGPREVGSGWTGFRHVFAGTYGTLYGIAEDGTLRWYRHDGQPDGSAAWVGPHDVGNGWGRFGSVFAAEGGVVYAIAQDGTLNWYRHLSALTGTFDWLGPRQVGTGWGNFLSACAS
jgi:hypothetical protein